MLNGRRGFTWILAFVVFMGVLGLSSGPGAQAPARVEPASLVIHNGKIVTVDEA